MQTIYDIHCVTGLDHTCECCKLHMQLLIALDNSIDNHDSGNLGMAIQLYVQAHDHLSHYHILTQKKYSQKLIPQLKSTPVFTYNYICT